MALPLPWKQCEAAAFLADGQELTAESYDCGVPKPDDLTVAHADVTTPPSSASSASGWLTSSDAISHGRFPPGTVLAARYRIVGLLGKGGMGEVYRADDLKLGQQVALKFLPVDLASDPMRLAQFHSEVRLTRQIAHPNVCRVYDVDEVDGHPFLSMEYVDGEDLSSLLRQVGRFAEDKALAIARQFCAGVAAAHDRGVLHRDLKPANVMLDDRGNVRVMDFGLAVATGTAPDVHGGTPGYMAPEQLAGRAASTRSDVYAIGLVLYELFTGKRVFDAKNFTELLRLHDENAVTPPTRLVPSLDAAIERAILRCLQPQPEQRPASALAVAAALPGGDPLAAALAAGETPSPAMVAAAGAEEALSARIVTAAIATVAIGLAVLPLINDRALMLRAVSPLKPVDVLVDRAQTIRRTLGYAETPHDEYFRFAVDRDYLGYIERTDRSPGRWARLRGGRPAAVTFWYRSSPRDLVSLSPGLAPLPGDPPLNVSGMTIVVLDGQGRLTEFNAVPPQREPADEATTSIDWAQLFAAAELPMEAFSPSPPSWTPRVYADTRVAWQGTLPEAPDTQVQIEAAAYRGKPVFFQIIGPWSRAGRMELPAEPSSAAIVSLLGMFVVGLLLLGTAFVARRQLRRGRGDRRGADRVALFIMGVFVLSWFIDAHHVPDVAIEINAVLMALAVGLLIGGVIWLFYLALEPLVRRWQARALVGWTRLIGGALRDAQVGRDVLAGVVAGVLYALIRAPRSLMSTLAGTLPPTPVSSSFAPLFGVRETIADLVQILPNAITSALTVILLFAVLRLVFRGTMLASVVVAALMVGFVALQLMSQAGGWAQLPLVIAGMALVFTMVVRFGLLATVVMFYVGNALELVPLTADLSSPYFSAALWIAMGVLVLAVWAAQAARAGKGLLRLEA